MNKPIAKQLLVDTSVWLQFFRGAPAIVRQFEVLMATADISISGVILQEILQGSRDEAALRKLQFEMRLWTCLEEIKEDFIRAAEIYARLRWKGKTIPSSDCLVAAVAIRHGCALWAEDGHFNEISELILIRAE